MPEAVIVATARSPIGRAFKGSLRDIRPDDLAAQIVRAALDKVPALDPTTIDDLNLGCGLPGGEQGFNMARVVAVLAGLRPPARHHGHPLLLVVAADHPDGLARDQGRRGRRVRLRRRRDGLPVRQGQLRPLARHPEPALRRRPRRRTAKAAEGGAGLARPARGRHAARRLHRDGPDRRERGAGCTGHPRGAWTSSASARRTSPRRPSPTASGPARSPRSRCRTAPWSAPTTARAPASPSRRSRGSSRCSARTARHRRQLLPAQRRRRRRWWS